MKFQLSAFIAVSCLAHASLLLWREPPPPLQLHIGGHAESLHITVIAPATPAPPAKEVAALEAIPRRALPQQRPQPVSTPQQELRRQSAKPSRPRLARSTAIPAATVRKTATAPPQAPLHSSSLSVSERVSAALQNQLAERFEYPWLARKRGWQGLVTLSLHIDENGDVSQWRIARTSGYNVLDRSALEAASHIDRLQQAERLLDGKSLNLSIPVRYQLIDS
jgi:protein TonB